MMYISKLGERIFNALTSWLPTSSDSSTALSRKRDYFDFHRDVDSDEEMDNGPSLKRSRLNEYDPEDALTRSGSLQNKRIFKSWLASPIRNENDLKLQQVKQRDSESISAKFLIDSAMANKENFSKILKEGKTNREEIKYLGSSTKVPTPVAKSFLSKIDPSFKFSPKLTSTVHRDSVVSKRRPFIFSRSHIYDEKNILSLKSSSMKQKKCSRLSTAAQCVQLGEKSLYKQLIDQHTSSDIFINKSVNPALLISHLNPKYTSAKREFLENLEKNGTSFHVEVTNPTKCSRDSSILKNKSSEIPLIDLSEEEFTSKNYQDDDEIFVTKVIRPKSPEQRRNALEEKFLASEFYHDEFFQNRKAEDKEKEKFRQKALEKPFKILHEREKFRQTSFREQVDKITKGLEVLNTEYPRAFTELPDEEEEDELPELTKEALLLIDRAFKGGPINQVLVEKFNIQITRKDIHTLHGLNWLNDEIINFYMNLIVERSQNEKMYPSVYAFNTFFYSKLIKTGFKSVQRWTKKVDIFAHNLLLIPVHLGMHWCLATIDFRSKSIRYYDSMLGDNYKCLEELRRYLESEHQDKKKSSYESSLLKTVNVKDIPQQMNGSDCGMFSCKFAEYLSRNAAITFTQENMPYFRKRMVFEIVTKKLMTENLKPYK